MAVIASILSAENLQRWWDLLQGVDPGITMAIVFTALFLAGFGLPIPEDVPLVFSGIMLSSPRIQSVYGGFAGTLIMVVAVCYTAILTGDVVAHQLGSKVGPRLQHIRPFRWMITQRRMRLLNRWFHRYGNWTVFLGRLVAGVRWVMQFTSGVAGMPIRTFLFYDTLATFVTVPAWIAAGYLVGTHFDVILVWISRVNTATWILAGVGIVVLLVIRTVAVRRKERRLARQDGGE